jgi:hypothetical protein
MTYFFIHTPKTSGTTLVDVLQKDTHNNIGYFYPPIQEMEKFEKRTKEGPFYHLERNPDWKKFNFIVGHFTFGIHDILGAKDFRYIGVIRSPVTHYISAYKALLRMPEQFQKLIFNGRTSSIHEFLKLDYTHNMQTFYLSGLSQKEIKEDKERAYQTAIKNYNQYFSGIYPTERFDEALFYFKRKIGIEPKYYRKKNVALNKISDVVGNDVIEKIKSVNDVDIRLHKHFSEHFAVEFDKMPFIKTEVMFFKAMNYVYGLLK